MSVGSFSQALLWEVRDGVAQSQGGGHPCVGRCHRGTITGLVTSPDGSLLFSACSQGTLAQYHCAATCCRVLRVAGQAPVPSPTPASQAPRHQVPGGVGLA